MHTRWIPAVFLTLPACVLDKDLGDSPMATEGSTDEPGATGSDQSPTGEGPDSTTGVPIDCPEGQPHLAPLWHLVYEEPEFGTGFYSEVAPVRRLADGRIAAPGGFNREPDKKGVGFLVAQPDGQSLAAETSSLSDRGGGVDGFVVGPDGQALVLGWYEKDPIEDSVVTLSRFTADLQLVSRTDVPYVTTLGGQFGPTMAIGADGPVIAGLKPGMGSPAEHGYVLLKLHPDTGAPVWQHEFDPESPMIINEIAIGPTGDIAVAGHGDTGPDPEDTLGLWRFDAAGALIWRRVITVPRYEEVTAVHFAPDDQIVALRNGWEEAAAVDLVSVAVADGATRWALTVAPVEGKFGGWAEDMHVDADRLTIPMSRSQWHHRLHDDQQWFEVRTVSFDGELLEVTELPGVYDPYGNMSWRRSARGRCGELVLFREDDNGRSMMAFAR